MAEKKEEVKDANSRVRGPRKHIKVPYFKPKQVKRREQRKKGPWKGVYRDPVKYVKWLFLFINKNYKKNFINHQIKKNVINKKN